MPIAARHLLFVLICLAVSCADSWVGAEEPTISIASNLYAPLSSSTTDDPKAQQLLASAKQAAAAGKPSLALQLATEALQHDPNEPTCRRVLGYELVDGQWLTPFQQKQISRGFVWDARFGWIKADDLSRYEAGERRSGRRWLSTVDDAAQHQTIETGWQVRTDHFAVTTNHSLAAAAKLSAELEQLFQVWRQLFAGYYLGDEEVLARFEGTRRARTRSKPFNVIYHRDKSGYVAALQNKQPRIGETLGIYFDDLREAHFYHFPLEHSDKANSRLRETLYHEAVHQLFQESQKSKRGIGKRDNFWAVEGVATYFESLVPVETNVESTDGVRQFTIGTPGAGRLPAARNRLLTTGEQTPLAELAALGMNDLQRQPNLPQLYSQMAAVATFLMHAEDGAHREGFVRYLKTLYAGRADGDSLFETTKLSPGELDKAYRRWLAGIESEP